MSRTCYRSEIDAVAAKCALDPDLVEAQVVVESAGHADAFRFESGFWARYMATNPDWGFARANPRRYSSSYGLLQILFPVAYEMGFRGEPEDLFKPLVGLEWGCKKLSALIAWANLKGPTQPEGVRLRSALAAYNGGHLKNEPDFAPDRNADYAEKVMRIYARPR